MAEGKSENAKLLISKKKVAVVVGLFLVLVVAGVLTVRAVTSSKEGEETSDQVISFDNDKGNEDSKDSGNTEGDVAGSDDVVVDTEDKGGEKKGDLNGDGASDENISNENAGNSGEDYDFANWKANDYKSGDITGERYTVKYGDTLWEIAEAKYGTGFKWQTIFDANEIGYLPNGNPLIVPGQVLILPSGE